jgi:hypothetical protein
VLAKLVAPLKAGSYSWSKNKDQLQLVENVENGACGVGPSQATVAAPIVSVTCGLCAHACSAVGQGLQQQIMREETSSFLEKLKFLVL